MTPKKSYKILLLDDSPEDRATYSRYLRQEREHDYEILEAESATIALEMCQEFLPDLILLDYNLPDMDGLALWQILRQQWGEEAVPVLMMTGQGNEAIAAQSIKQGIQDYLIKGNLTAESLRKTVIHTIKQFQLQQQLRQQKQQIEAILKAAKKDLEIRVLERTEELKTVNNRLQQELIKRAEIEKQLRQSEARYRAIVEDQTELIARFNSDNLMLFVNDAFCHYFNVQSEEIIGKNYAPVIYPTDQEKVAQLIASITRENPIVMIENRVIDGRGEIRWTQWVNRMLFDTQENLIEFQAVGRDITELKQIEQALHDSEESRRLALDLTHLGFWDMDLLNNTIIWNDNHFLLLGLEAFSVEPSYELWRSHIHPDDLTFVEQQFRESLETHTDYVAEYRVIYPDNSVHWLIAKAKAIYDEAGQAMRSLGVLIDVTDRKLAEQKIQQQAEQEKLRREVTQRIRQTLDLQTIFDTACQEIRQVLQADRVGIFKFDPDSGYDNGEFVAESAVNGLATVLGVGIHDHCFGEKYAQLYVQGQYCAIDDIYHNGLENCHIKILSQFQVWANLVIPLLCGEELWGLLCIHQCFNARSWHQSDIDLTQQLANQLAIAIQQSEFYNQLQIELQERKQREAVLREAERRWLSLLDNVQLLVVELDLSGIIRYVNPFFLNLTGYNQSEVLGENWFAKFLPTSKQVLLQQIFSDVLNNRAYPYYQNTILTKSGEERFIAWNNTILQDSQENIIGTISIGEDITERQKVERIKDEFIGIVSHELRTPLTAIQMSLGLVQTGIYANKPEKTARMIEIALMDTNRLANLVNNILDLERLESGQTVLEKMVCQAMDLMQQSVNIMQAIATQQNITLEIIPTNVQVWAEPDTIIQTLTNLLSNAIKFSTADATIYLQAEPQANAILFQVRDQGRGIPEEKLETIFGRFQQVDVSDSREKGGTGLGLSICLSIIEKHGGKIWAESILNQGSTFFFTLPILNKNNL